MVKGQTLLVRLVVDLVVQQAVSRHVVFLLLTTTVGAKYNFCHVSRSCDILTVSHRVSSVYSVMLSVHFFGGLPLWCTPPSEGSNTFVTS